MNPAQQPKDPTSPTASARQDLPIYMNMPRLHASESDMQYSLQDYLSQQEANVELHYELEHKRLLQERHKMQQHVRVSAREFVDRQQIAFQQQQNLINQQQMENELAKQQHLAHLQNKTSDQHSAVASNEVKAALRNKLLIRSNPNIQSPPHLRNWPGPQHHSLDQQHSPPTSGLSPPPPRTNPPVVSNAANQYPLRKTASEPNLIKMRRFATSDPNLKLIRPRPYPRNVNPAPKSPHSAHRSHMLHNNGPALFSNTVSVSQPGASDPDSGPNTPPSTSLPENATLEKLPEYGPAIQQMSKMVNYNQSMPNISVAQTREAMQLAGIERAAAMEAAMAGDPELRAKLSAMYGMHMNSATPLYPIPMAEGATPEAYIAHYQRVMEQAALLSAESPAHYQHRGHGLTRTHSAPLPLSFYQHSMWLHKQQEELMRQANPKHYLKQRLQSSILQRAGVRATMENVDEAAETRLREEMRDIREKEEEETLAMEQQIHEDTISRMKRSKVQQALLQKIVRTQLRDRPIPYHAMPDSLQRAKSYPTVRTSPPIPEHISTTGLAYDSLMLKHQCVCGVSSNHEENPDRLQSIYNRLQESGLASRCNRIETRKATIEELKSCHSEAYALLYGSDPKKLAQSNIDPKMFQHLLVKFCELACGGVGVDCDTTWNEGHTPTATRIAVGGVVDLALKVASGELENGFALVRPPGHHAEPTLAMGYCFFNNVAIAAKQLLANQFKKVLIVDWDVHHGNSTQQVFYADSRVLYISIHRHDNGNFFPGTGAPEECGIERGLGYNVNIAWSSNLEPPMADAEYLAAFRTMVMPIAREFQPELVLVSAGFDGAAGHSPKLGGYEISAACFGYMTEELRTLAGGKLVLSLEGGYHLPSICDCSEMCIRVLLDEKVLPVSKEEMLRPPCAAAIATLSKALEVQSKHWPCLKRQAHTVAYSHAEAVRSTDETHTTMRQLASLSVVKEIDSEDKASDENDKTEDMES